MQSSLNTNGVAHRDGNREVFSRKAAVSVYEHGTLQNAESVIFLRFQEYLLDQRVLDIGFGGGRTSAILLQCTPHYVGVDYSPQMVEIGRSRFPEADLREGDARDLGVFPEGSFDFVLFSFNGIDYIGHDDRLRVFQEIRRVLKPGRLFVFSSHNRNYEYAVTAPRLTFARNPATQIRLIRQYWNCRRNRSRNKVRQRFEEEYAIINDLAHEYPCSPITSPRNGRHANWHGRASSCWRCAI